MGLRWVDGTTLIWDAEAAAVEYHVYRGDLRDGAQPLSFANFGTCADAELDPVDRTDELVVVTGSPGAGQGWSFLITAEDGTGEEGTLGFNSSAERSNFNPCAP